MATPKAPKPRAGIYVRLSRDSDAQTSTERQEADARALCTAKGYEVADVYADVGISGYKAVERPQFERLLADVDAGRIDVIVVWKLDRLTRKGIREIAPILDLLDRTGARLVAVQDSIDTSTPMGEAVLGLLASLAKQESANISTRTKSAKAHAANKGLPAGGGRRPFGFTSTLFDKIVDDEAVLVREARDRLLAGESVRSVVNDWNDRGLVTPTGKAWTTARLGRMIRSPHLAGLRSHMVDGRRSITQGTWAPIISEADHAALVGTAGQYNPATVRAHLLTGVLVCSKCGENTRCKTTARFGRQYLCYTRGCGAVGVKSDVIEDVIGEAVALRLAGPAAVAAMEHKSDADELAAVAKMLDEDREAIQRLSQDYYVTRAITVGEFTAARDALVERIDVAERRLTAARSTDLPIDPVEAWNDGDLYQKRLVLGQLVDQIVLSPTKRRGPGFDPDRITVSWKV